MTYPERLAVLETELRGQDWTTVANVARELDNRRGTPGYDEHHAIVSHAANNVLRDHFASDTADWSTAERIAYVSTMPNVQRDPVMRALTSSVERVLDRAYPGVSDEAFDRWQALELDDDGASWPAYLASAYARAALEGVAR